MTFLPTRMTAAILAGGLGTRLRSVVADRPKVMAEVHNIPMLAHLLEKLTNSGIEHVVLCTGYRGDQIRSAMGNSYGKLRLSYSHESSPLGTAGALRLALPLFESESVLVMNGDSLCDVDLADVWLRHQELGVEGTIVLTELPDTSRYGSVGVNEQGLIVSFDEKQGSATSGWINAGIYLLNRSLIETIPAGGPCSLERQMFPEWIPRKLHGYIYKGQFLDIGTPESYALAETIVDAPQPRNGKSMRQWPFVILDRDGTLIVERNYLSNPDEVELIPGTVEGLRELSGLGFGLVVITNQSGVGRGYFDEAQVAAIHQRLTDLLAGKGISLAGIYYCPHTPEDRCRCRKPHTKLLESASAELEFDPRRSFVIGDKACDIDLGRNAGATTILVRTGYGNRVAAEKSTSADYVADDVRDAARIIARLVTSNASDGKQESRTAYCY